MNKRRLFHSTIAVVLSVLGLIFITTILGQQILSRPGKPTEYFVPTAQVPPEDLPGRLDRPQLSEPPLQVEQGNLVFWTICMSCHGDRSQGLTEEWRNFAFPQDKDCWKSRCHASEHPPQSFELPQNVPALVGEDSLENFSSAGDLFNFILTLMPFWNPGSLTPDQSWQVTAYLLMQNDVLPKGIIVNGIIAAAIPIHHKVSPPENDEIFVLSLTGIICLTALAWIVRESSMAKISTLRTQALTASPNRRGLRRPGFVSHLHPPTIPADQARWRYTLGAGGTAVFLCLVLLATGLLEMFYYIPTTSQAPVTIETIHYFVPFGSLIRNLHYWSAQLLIVVSAIHLLRVIFTGAYSYHRRFNFVLGMVLFALLLVLDFSGYILRWDEGIRWALVAGTNLLNTIPLFGQAIYHFIVGGSRVGPATLVRFYSWHSFTLAVLAASLLIWHIFRIRRDGGISTPSSRVAKLAGYSPATWENAASSRHLQVRIPRAVLLRREVLGILVVSIILFLLSTFAPAPLDLPIQGTPTMNADTRAPWFFLWVQQMLKLGDPFLLGVLLPFSLLVIITCIPYILPGPSNDESGQWFPRRGRLAQIVIAFIAFTIMVLTLLSLLPSSNV